MVRICNEPFATFLSSVPEVFLKVLDPSSVGRILGTQVLQRWGKTPSWHSDKTQWRWHPWIFVQRGALSFVEVGWILHAGTLDDVGPFKFCYFEAPSSTSKTFLHSDLWGNRWSAGTVLLLKYFTWVPFRVTSTSDGNIFYSWRLPRIKVPHSIVKTSSTLSNQLSGLVVEWIPGIGRPGFEFQGSYLVCLPFLALSI